MNSPTPLVISVNKSETHSFNKMKQDCIHLMEGLGVKDDAHCGKEVQHLSRVKKDPSQANLRQVHLIHSELHHELKEKGFDVKPGDLGENITTSGIDILSLPKDTILKIGDSSEIMITGLRNPCSQLNNFKEGLMQAVLDKDEDGNLIRKCGVMAIVLKSGDVMSGDKIEIVFPEGPYYKLEPV